MSEKFTKGPWSINHTGPHWNNPELANIEINYGEDQECVCDTVYEISDAHLIAAAPDMYEMLKECQREIEFLINEVNQHRTTNHSRYEDTPPDLYDQESLYLIGKLLAKARGEL